jgi:hypothetical protein
MMGFGSDSYQGYMGGGSSGNMSTNYAPPGGQSNSLSLGGGSSGHDKKWGAKSSPRENTEYKPMGNSFDKKPTTTTGVPIV